MWHSLQKYFHGRLILNGTASKIIDFPLPSKTHYKQNLTHVFEVNMFIYSRDLGDFELKKPYKDKW